MELMGRSPAGYWHCDDNYELREDKLPLFEHGRPGVKPSPEPSTRPQSGAAMRAVLTARRASRKIGKHRGALPLGASIREEKSWCIANQPDSGVSLHHSYYLDDTPGLSFPVGGRIHYRYIVTNCPLSHFAWALYDGKHGTETPRSGSSLGAHIWFAASCWACCHAMFRRTGLFNIALLVYSSPVL
eukprot:1192400-Prorocentrum_minimum.AAC.5